MDPGSSHQGSCSRPNSGPFRVAYIARLLVLLLLVVRHTLARRIIFYSKVTFNGRLVIAARVTIKIPKILIRACDRLPSLPICVSSAPLRGVAGCGTSDGRCSGVFPFVGLFGVEVGPFGPVGLFCVDMASSVR